MEIVKTKVDDTLTITVEVFQVPEGYKSFAHNSYVHHYDLLGSGMHKEKKESIELAIKDLYEVMREFDNNKSF